MNIHVQFDVNLFVVSEKKAFEHFPIGSNAMSCGSFGFPNGIL